MTVRARRTKPALRAYEGSITKPDRWACWVPRAGDVLVVTPPKSGTTWTQSIVAMLLNGGPELPDKVSVLSPWADGSISPPEKVTAALAAQKGRRVLKTHTPADGFAICDGVSVISVFRHPLDVFFSLRKHIANAKIVDDDHIMRQSLEPALSHFVNAPEKTMDWDNDCLSHIVRMFRETCLMGRIPGLMINHYADMLADHRGTVARIAEHIRCAADPALIDAVTAATSFASMKQNADNFAPQVNDDVWHNTGGFFDAGTSQKWLGKLTKDQIASYEARLAELLPDPAARHWLQMGGAWPPKH